MTVSTNLGSPIQYIIGTRCIQICKNHQKPPPSLIGPSTIPRSRSYKVILEGARLLCVASIEGTEWLKYASSCTVSKPRPPTLRERGKEFPTVHAYEKGNGEGKRRRRETTAWRLLPPPTFPPGAPAFPSPPPDSVSIGYIDGLRKVQRLPCLSAVASLGMAQPSESSPTTSASRMAREKAVKASKHPGLDLLRFSQGDDEAPLQTPWLRTLRRKSNDTSNLYIQPLLDACDCLL